MQIFFVANWKMNMSMEEISEYSAIFKKHFQARADEEIDVVFCPPYPYLGPAHDYLTFLDNVALGSQNAHWLDSGAHTGEVSIPMLKEFGVEFAIIGHSERRQFYGETNEAVSKRAKACLQNGIRPIVCVGEMNFSHNSVTEVLDELKFSLKDISQEEASNLIVAYEPVWAIGTGKAATVEIIKNVHDKIRAELSRIFPKFGENIPLLYGGSTSAENIAEIMSVPNVSGALVGGASLKPEVFAKLIKNGRLAKKIS